MSARPLRFPAALAGLLVLVSALWLGGCGGEPKIELAGDQLRPVPAMRFAGVDAMYALRRVAQEADLPLCLEDIRTKDNSPDLGIYRVDVDLPAGPVFETMRKLQEATGAFDFRVEEGVIWVRSALTMTTETLLDEPVVTPREFEGDIGDLVDMIMEARPFTFLRLMPIVGEREPPVVKLSIKKNTSPVALMIEYTKKSGMGWWMRRAGYVKEKREDKTTVVGTSITPWSLKPSRYPIGMEWGSLISGLADVSKRTGTPMVVLDRSVLQRFRGALSYTMLFDPNLPFDESIGILEAVNNERLFRWERVDDGVVLIRSSYLLGKLAERGFLREELKGGSFEGSLPELARFINGNYKDLKGVYLMAGEILPGQPTAKLEIPEGATPVDALVEFTKASGQSVYLVVLDHTNPVSGEQIVHPSAWRGAYLAPLSDHQKGTEAFLKGADIP